MRRLPPDSERPSRSALKRAAAGVTDLAEQLADLPEAAFRRLPLSAALLSEFVQVRAMKASGARARQLRHLGSALRADPEVLAQLQATLAGHTQVQRDDARALHRLEELRARLLDPQQSAAALAEVMATLPDIDRSALQHAIHACRDNNDKKAFRSIFRLLQSAFPGRS
jgi:ribosome-associated protein